VVVRDRDCGNACGSAQGLQAKALLEVLHERRATALEGGMWRPTTWSCWGSCRNTPGRIR